MEAPASSAVDVYKRQVLPPAAMGPVVALIGLELAANTVAGGTTGANPVSYTHLVIVSLTENQEVCAVDVEHIAALDRQSVVQSISDILASGDDSGYSGYYRFGVFDEPDGGSTVIMLDCFLQIQSAFNMLRITLLMSGACAAVVFVLLAFFSKKAIAPSVSYTHLDVYKRQGKGRGYAIGGRPIQTPC